MIFLYILLGAALTYIGIFVGAALNSTTKTTVTLKKEPTE